MTLHFESDKQVQAAEILERMRMEYHLVSEQAVEPDKNGTCGHFLSQVFRTTTVKQSSQQFSALQDQQMAEKEVIHQ